MDTSSESLALATANELLETLVSEEQGEIYAELAKAEMRFSPASPTYLPNPDDEIYDQDSPSTLGEIFGGICSDTQSSDSTPDSELSDCELSNSSDVNELDDGIFFDFDSFYNNSGAIPDSKLSNFKRSNGSENVELQESTFSLLLNSNLTISDEDFDNFYNNSGAIPDNKLSDLECSNSASSLSLKPEPLSSDEDLDISYNDSDADKIKSLSKVAFAAKDTGKICHRNFREQLLRARSKPTRRAPKKKAPTRTKQRKYLPTRRLHLKPTEWRNVPVRVEAAGIESHGKLIEYREDSRDARAESRANRIKSRAERNSWRSQSRRCALEYTGTRGDVRVYPRLDDDELAMYELGFITYLDVRVNGLVPIRIKPDEERGTFSGYDEASQKHLRIGAHQVRALIEQPEESIILKLGVEE